jgi:dephospho-CoA kinase
MASPQSLRIGLTGGIGSGKSTVAGLLADLGALVVDTDAIARRLTQPGGDAMAAIAAEFGAAFVDADGALDRARMRERVFAEPDARRRLEAILHPLIRSETARQASLATGSVVVFDVPLLVESGRWREQVDRVVVVDCSEETQIARVMARSGWTADAVRKVIGQQSDRGERRACADAVVHNDGLSLEKLTAEIRALWEGWCAGL